MSKFLKFVRDNYNSISVIVFFLITALLLLYLLPREGKFRYEFQRGRPWLHETLIAPFDFPIYKPESELRAERDSVLADLRPYFRYDSLLYDSVIVRYHDYLEQQWKAIINENQENAGSGRSRGQLDRFRNFSTGLYRHVYQNGIMAPGETTDRIVAEETSIVILRNNIGIRTPPANYFREKTAYEYVRNGIDRWSAERAGDGADFSRFLQSVDFSMFIVPNLYYDQATTDRVRQSLLNEISLARGMVQSGERIVSQGDLITYHTYLILESLKREYENRLLGTNLNLVLLGQFILVLSLITLLYLFLFYFRREILSSARKTLFILFFLFLMVSSSIILIRFSMINFYVVPFAIVPIIIRTFYDERLALFIHTIILLLVAFFAPNSFEFLFLNYVVGLVAIFSLSNIYLRSKLFYTAVIIVLSYSLLYFGIAVTQERSIANIDWMNFAWFGANGLLVLTTYPLLYIFEKTFGFISDGTLMELSDTNQPLLRKLAEDAPGTFQHSIQVANLAEAAVREIGGNPLLVRAGALYHDIGKISEPMYFIENQASGYNPHDSLDFEESAQVIISHVTSGVELARKYNLPEQIIDFIRTHHGTTRVQYFYKSFLKKYPNEDVDAMKYTYPGPRPFSRETAILMMADSVEAASKSLKEISTESLNTLVEYIIDNQFKEEQFVNTELTFKDIATVKDIYKIKLKNIYHARISYPK
jgi:cyclic-di-AMP phosphodiesterase PgpH